VYVCVCVKLTCYSLQFLCFRYLFIRDDNASLLYFSRSFMTEKLERNVVSWEIQHTKVEFMVYVSAICFHLCTVLKLSMNKSDFQHFMCLQHSSSYT